MQPRNLVECDGPVRRAPSPRAILSTSAINEQRPGQRHIVTVHFGPGTLLSTYDCYVKNNSRNSVVTEPHKGRPISTIARELGVPDEHLLRYGHDKAKIELSYLASLSSTNSRLVLMTAISPTPAGEGKTTTSIGLADGLRRLGVK